MKTFGSACDKARTITMNFKHEIILYWSNEDSLFIAEVPELAGCIAHGDSQEAALASVKEAMQLWIDTAQEFGDPIPVPKGRRLMLA
jgi:predicted RNase H-like HicB family nuclease